MLSASRARIAGALLLGLLASCGSLAYQRAWEAFDAERVDDPAVGRWEGTWRSEWNGHSGGLRCMTTRAEEGAYLARFHSTYGWFLSFRHEARLRVVEKDGEALRFEGDEDLGAAFGGVYQYEVEVRGGDFEARYRAENGDHGVFSMRRVE